jgi:glycosyltransferase involved in cell wall biosynthesis
MVGRIAPWKGQHVFLEAFARAFPGGDVRARVVGAPLFGEDAYDQGLRRLAVDLRIADRVEFTGFREDVARELGSLDVLVHGSVIPEPFGQVVAEGLAAGLPVVAAAAGGPSELVENGVNGVLYPPGDVPALEAVLRELASDPGLRMRLATAARTSARRFLSENVAEEVLRVYRSVVASSHG